MSTASMMFLEGLRLIGPRRLNPGETAAMNVVFNAAAQVAVQPTPSV